MKLVLLDPHDIVVESQGSSRNRVEPWYVILAYILGVLTASGVFRIVMTTLY